MRVLLCGTLGLALTLFAPAPATSAESTPSPRAADANGAEAQQLVFLLQYVGSDYASAVREGRVVDEGEYRENREFTALIAERFARLRASVPPTKVRALESAVGKLVELVGARADPGRVKEVTETAIPLLVESFALRAFPKDRPDTERAARLYAENCTPCHGPRGGGNGPRAKDLDPPPARFSDPERMRTAAPYLFYNAITLGIANTSMASFAEALSDQERWDLAFYLWSFVLPEGQSAAPPRIVLSLRDLATRSSAELAPEVIRQASTLGAPIDARQASLWLAQLRAHPPVLSDPQEQLARLRQDLKRSVSLVEGGEVDAAADLVTNAYLAEFEPLEPELDRRDGRVRQSFEQGLIEFRAALRHGDRQRALATAAMLEKAVDRAAELLGSTPTQPIVSGRSLALIALSAAAIGGALAIRRIGKRGMLG